MNKVTLALLGKLIKLYEIENETKEVFISLETTPMPYTDRDFMFADKAGNDAQKLREAKQNQYQFFEQSDLIPKVSHIWHNKIGEFSKLSNVYEYVLKRAIPLEESLTDEQQFIYDQSKQLLESDKKNVYDEYKETYEEMENEILNIRLELISTENPEKIDLLNKKKQILENRLDEHKNEWVAHGFKNEIKNALATFTRLDNIKNSSVHREWNQAKDDFKKFTEDAIFSGITYKPTFYQPVNFNNKKEGQSGWRKISISKGEINKLANLAKKSFYAGEQYSDDSFEYEIDKINFEIIDLTINRPWFKPDMLMQKNWDLIDKDRMLSTDEKDKEQMLPAYIMSLLMARNVDVELSQTKNNQEKIQKMQVRQAPLQIGPLLLNIPESKSSQSIKKVSMPKKMNATKASLFRTRIKEIDKKDSQNLKTLQTKTAEVNKHLMLFEPTKKKSHIKPIKHPKKAVSSKMMASQAFIKPILIPTIIGKTFGFKGQIEGKGLAGKQISIRFMNLHNKGKSKVVKSDKDGKYVARLEPGSYKIIVNMDGYVPFEKVMSRSKGQPSMKQVDIVLQPEFTSEMNESEIEKQYEGYLLLGYKCRKLPKLPDPVKH